jgi:hypothetical protein
VSSQWMPSSVGRSGDVSNRLIEPNEEVGRTTGEIACRERLGGMLRYYYRKAA